MLKASAQIALLLAAEQGLASPVPKSKAILPHGEVSLYEPEVMHLCAAAAARTDIQDASQEKHKWCKRFNGNQTSCEMYFASSVEGYKLCEYKANDGSCSAGAPFICPESTEGEAMCAALAVGENLKDKGLCKSMLSEEDCQHKYISSDAGYRLCHWFKDECIAKERSTPFYCPPTEELCGSLSNKQDLRASQKLCRHKTEEADCASSYITVKKDVSYKLCRFFEGECEASYEFKCEV